MTLSMDRRYKTARWKKLRLVILARDAYTCWVADCPISGNVCDHIDPVYPGMPDSEFYGHHNLRASCKRHNTARGVAARLERETAVGVAPAPRRCSYGHSAVRRGSGFLGGTRDNDRPLPKSLSPSSGVSLTRDYTRREVDSGAA